MTDTDKPDDHSKKLERRVTTRSARTKAWLQENKPAIDAHNERVDSRGMYNAGLRRF